MTRLLFGAVVAATALASTGGWAQTFPSKPVHFVVGFATGGGTDTLGRLLADRLREMWGQSVVVENKPGADGSIAAEYVSRTAPDGYNLVLITNAHTITPSLGRIPYDPVNDFAPVTLLAMTPNLLVVHPSVPARTVSALIAHARAKPGVLNYGSSGAGTSPYLAMELFKQMAGVEIQHIPFKGSAPAVSAVRLGEIQVMFGAVPTTLPHVKSGSLVALAISTKERHPSVPDLPTVAEAALPGFEAVSWYGVLAPPKTPPALVEKISRDMREVMMRADMKVRLEGLGFDPVANTPAEFKEVIVGDIARWSKVIRATK